MSGREAGHQPAADADSLEIVPGKHRENLEGWVPELASAEEVQQALEQAFDYRGDVLITRKDGSKVEGYIFDRRSGRTLQESLVRILPKDGRGKVTVSYADIAALAFTGRDMAAGKSWETWVRQYWEKRMAGEHISLHPEELE
ncbi:MAG TPA: hypothetical protein VLC12_04500 [Terriglobales bacterium]|nr:hypothetical protein [Terriglobales bacterium]